jgi:hypothetical protein
VTALARSSSTCASKFQTRSLVREGTPLEKTVNTVSNKTKDEVAISAELGPRSDNAGKAQ